MQTNFFEKEELETDSPIDNLKKLIYLLTIVGDLKLQISNGCMDLQVVLQAAVEKKILPVHIYKEFDRLLSSP